MTARDVVRAIALAGALAVVALAAGCERERRDFDPPKGASSAPASRATSNRPGAHEPLRPGLRPDRPGPAHEVESNAFLVNNGKRLYRWYNCNGCHAQGGGGFGPALMDAAWLYGAEPADIYVSIVEGRPGGMPAFGGRIPEDQVWQLVAYVRSLGGHLRKDAAPSRADGLAGAPPENTRRPMPPVAAPQDPAAASAPASAPPPAPWPPAPASAASALAAASSPSAPAAASPGASR
jgi:cytochrome c oxidase cbb3-type subunit 3